MMSPETTPPVDASSSTNPRKSGGDSAANPTSAAQSTTEGGGAPASLRTIGTRIASAHVVPFIVLVGVVVGFAVLFYHVVQPLLLPLFVAAVLAMLLTPLHQRLTQRLYGYKSCAALVVIALAVLVIVGPMSTAIFFAVGQLRVALNEAQQYLKEHELKEIWNPEKNPGMARLQEQLDSVLGDKAAAQAQSLALKVASGAAESVYQRTMGFLGDLPNIVLGIFILLVGLYFFLVDGPAIVRGWEELSPMSPEHDRLLRVEFMKVCRGVVWATVVAAACQGLFLGLGLMAIDAFAGTHLGGWIYLLALITVMLAMIPFLGAASVWVPLVIYFFLTGHYIASVVMLVYGAAFISTVDNLIKIIVIKDSANMHPLLVIVSVFGGIKLIGLLGIFIGPIVAAVMFALMKILKQELLSMEQIAPTAST